MDIQQVAKGAKVSTAAVSRVLNGSPSVREKTSQHVRRVIAELNYVPNTHARSLRVGRARMFGLIVSDINNPFFPELIDAFEALAAQQGIDVIFMHTNYDPKRLQTYTVYVTPAAGTTKLVGQNYAFRTGAGTLNNLSLFAAVGSDNVCSFTPSNY